MKYTLWDLEYLLWTKQIALWSRITYTHTHTHTHTHTPVLSSAALLTLPNPISQCQPLWLQILLTFLVNCTHVLPSSADPPTLPNPISHMLLCINACCLHQIHWCYPNQFLSVNLTVASHTPESDIRIMLNCTHWYYVYPHSMTLSGSLISYYICWHTYQLSIHPSIYPAGKNMKFLVFLYSIEIIDVHCPVL